MNKSTSTWLMEVSLNEGLPIHRWGHRLITIIEVSLQSSYDTIEEERRCVTALALEEFSRRFNNCKVTKLLLKKLDLADRTLSDFCISAAEKVS